MLWIFWAVVKGWKFLLQEWLGWSMKAIHAKIGQLTLSANGFKKWPAHRGG
jgi:hypothetical protein